jgi:hypothetical protein
MIGRVRFSAMAATAILILQSKRLFMQKKPMYLILPESMIIPEILDRREDSDFEDWLTASLIENTNRENDDQSSSPGFTDLWMLEITQRDGRIWNGNFRVEFGTAKEDGSRSARMLEDGTGVLSFCLDTDTGEMRFSSEPTEPRGISRN